MSKQLHLYEVIKRPVITEKSHVMAEEHRQYVFEVDLRANKIQIAEAVMRVFNVDVLKVRTMVMPLKRAQRLRKAYVRQQSWKKAVVTVPADQSISLFEM